MSRRETCSICGRDFYPAAVHQAMIRKWRKAGGEGLCPEEPTAHPSCVFREERRARAATAAAAENEREQPGAAA